MVGFIPPAVFARAARATFSLATSRRGRPTWNLVISNVPGPQFPLYCAGARLVANYPVSVITDGMGLTFVFGGTTLLIIVGVAMDTVQQVESQLIMRHYDGFMKKTRIRGRRG